jgi:hypothetical protein
MNNQNNDITKFWQRELEQEKRNNVSNSMPDETSQEAEPEEELEEEPEEAEEEPQSPEQMARDLEMAQAKARKGKAQEPKEGVVEKVKRKAAMKIGTWVIVAAAEAIPIAGMAPTWTLKTFHSYLKAEKKGLGLLMIIIAACKDLLDALSVELLSGFDWIVDLIMGGLLVILDFYAGEEES